ncbi:hypothetical protein BXU06_12540 [Aquaspirillum sp. LM1]|uniref:hypothetical protein n=1 Tax=Aquaspirillum sp. LM1 TaxID=1938604 RepID=UPI0009840425|nr:hypothetical protein [Aquaspirillum sp. LM1]AQR65786.1 hypothetical protein BXU06_12540 [Aquaspirillum sp. LM1]
MHCALAECGVRLGRDKVRKLLKAVDLKTCWTRKFAHTTDSKHMLLGAKNLLTFYNQKRFKLGPGQHELSRVCKTIPAQICARAGLSA